MNASFTGAPWLLAAARVFEAAGQPLYAVGGAVRNAVMGLLASDMDLCGPARPDEVLRLCEGTPVRAVARAAHFGTVELHVADADGRHMAEYTTFRVDSYRGGHQPFAVRFASSPEEDALRRDFSVNALYCRLSAEGGTQAPILDPTGGLEHLRQGVLHTVTADPDQVLKDDGLRILRAARFQAELGLTPTPALLASARKHAGLLSEIALERLRDELARLLLADLRYPTLARSVTPVPAGLGTVLATGAWPALFGALLPDKAAIAATAHYRAPEGVPPVAGKLALLYRHATPETLEERMLLLRFATRDAQVARAALQAERAWAEGSLPRMDAVRLGVPAVAHAAAALQALALAGEPCASAAERARAALAKLQSGIPLSLRELAVHGDDLLPLCRKHGLPHRAVGRALDALWLAAVEATVANERAALLTKAESLLASWAREGIAGDV